MYSAANHQRETLTQCFDGVHPSWATSPWSSVHGLGLCISSMWKNVVYKALWLLIPTPMCLECQN